MKRKLLTISLILILCLPCFMGCGSGKEDSSETERQQTESQQTPQAQPQEPTTDGATSGTAAPSTSGALQVIGTKLCDSNGNPVMLRGLSTHGIAWFPDYINATAFKQFHEEWGANVMRLAMYTTEYNGYCTGGDQAWLKTLVKNGVEYATQNDMYVIIDWHILADGNPHTYKSEALAFFEEMSATYANYNNVIYEICNEPNGGTSWAQIKVYAEEIIPVIRANDKDAIIIVGTPNWCQYVKDAAADPSTGYDNIMYALHFYAATHTDWLRNDMVTAINSGLPIFVSEYGICDASGNGVIDEYQANQWMELLNQHGISYCGWNISNKGETSAIFGTWCNKTSGWTVDDLSSSGKWQYDMLRKYQLGK
ncbi:MAG: glycoside hydrolase family 5 protein [Agathobacter sp.]|nr:glycoside hydrolase family 5 protein [Agathobacter sp.]